ncbi:MAG: plastocyanin/azurin family copper-binding protein [Bacteroidota bacterium]
MNAYFKKRLYVLLAGFAAAGWCARSAAFAQTAPTEDTYYNLATLPIPEGLVMEVGGLATLPNGNLAASTRRGDVWIIENPYMINGKAPYYRHFAGGLHEILGMAYKDGDLYMAQRGELTRLRDKNGDGKADSYETVYAWPISGHYHEYSFGPKIAADGTMYVTANVAFGDKEWWRGESRVPWRGWTMQISPEGKMTPYATGMRSPCGIGMVNGEFFYADNQGDWMGSGAIFQVEKGDFTGHPAGLRWATRPESPVKVTTEAIYALADPRFPKPGQALVKPENDPNDKGTPLFEIAKKVPGVKLPAVWLPHTILGISTSEIVVDETNGAFGPFAGQLFVGDQGQSKIDRVFLEKVNGVYQGAAFAFREGFESGVLRISWGKDGSMFAGQTNRGWGSTGQKPGGIQRLIWTGKIPFEMKAVRATVDGFEVEFTQPVDKKTASDPASYALNGFIYKYHPVYGSPIINQQECAIKGIEVSADGMKVRLAVDGLRQKYIHELKAEGIRSQSALALLHNTAYYTLNEIPSGEKMVIKAMPAASSHAGHTPAKTSVATTAKATKAAATAATAKRVTEQPADWTNGPDAALVIGTKPGLKFDKTELTVKAGSKIKLTFNNSDDMLHNLVLVQPGQAVEVGNAAMKLGLGGEKLNYIPNTAKVLHHTKLMQPGTSDTIYFVAPTKPGNYTYVCTFPGHAFVMQGTLKVE